MNDSIGVQVTSKGELIYFYNGVSKGVAITGIPTNKEIFGIFDVYGRTKEVAWKYYGGNVSTGLLYIVYKLPKSKKIVACGGG